MKRLLPWGLALAIVPLAWAQADAGDAPPDNTAAYQRIEAQRTEALARFRAEDAECYKRFAVSGCLKDVQTRRRTLLSDLRNQEAALHEGELARQGLDQRKRLAQKTRDRQQLEADLRAEHGVDRAADKARDLQDRQDEHEAHAGKAAAVTQPVPTGPSAATQASMRESYARKQQDAEKKRQDVARRLADKAGKTAAPLPLPQ